MKLSVKGNLVVAINIVVDNKPLQCKEAELRDLTTGELFAARNAAQPGDYWVIAELAAKTQLIDEQGNPHQMTYEMLRDTSSANFKRLEELDVELQLKLNAESLQSQSA